MSRENEFALNGVTYVAESMFGKQNEGMGCLGCEFDANGCVAATNPCSRGSREDQKDIIWVRKLNNG